MTVTSNFFLVLLYFFVIVVLYMCISCDYYYLFKRVIFLLWRTYSFWKRKTGSAFKSAMSSPLPLAITSGCFLHKSQPTCEKKKPLVALCGSASVSEYLWWTRWSRAQCNAQSWNATVLKMANITLSGKRALYERCAHSLCAPAVMPKPPIIYKTTAEKKRRKTNHVTKKSIGFGHYKLIHILWRSQLYLYVRNNKNIVKGKQANPSLVIEILYHQTTASCYCYLLRKLCMDYISVLQHCI